MYECPKCYYKTNRKSSFKSHFNRKETCIRSIESYSKYNDLELSKLMDNYKLDINNYKKDELKKYKCHICFNKFTQKYNLNKHIKTFHNYHIINELTNNNDYNNIILIGFDNDWDLSHIDESSMNNILFSTIIYTKLLEEILNNKINLNVIIDDTNNSCLVYKNNIDKYVHMKLKDMLNISMNKLNKQLNDLQSKLSINVIDDSVKLSKEIIDKKIEDYNNKNNITEKVNIFLINIFKNVKNNAIEICKNIVNSKKIIEFDKNESGY
jgi:hypothetical protein